MSRNLTLSGGRRLAGSRWVCWFGLFSLAAVMNVCGQSAPETNFTAAATNAVTSAASNAVTNAAPGVAATTTAAAGALPDAGSSVIRVLGALALVTAIFLGGVWLFKNWQRFTLRKGNAPRLNVVEVKSLGQRQTLVVVAYEQQRMLLASSPAGVTLVTHLPAAEAVEAVEPTTAPRMSFTEAFQHVLTRK